MSNAGILFINQGELDIRLVTLMGANVKPSATPDGSIGRFGTGLKYSIATWLRNKCEVTIWSGVKRYDFEQEEEVIRGETFHRVVMIENRVVRHSLGFTTSLGKHWLPWMAYREMWSNAKDEGGERFAVAAEGGGEAGATVIFVRGEAALQAHASRSEWLFDGCNRHLLYQSNLLDIAEGTSRAVYYQGIKVYDIPDGKHSHYTYNLKGKLTLTEDRTAEQWNVLTVLGGKIIKADSISEEILTTLFLPSKSSFENDIPWNGWLAYGEDYCPAFRRAVEQIYLTHKAEMQQGARICGENWFASKEYIVLPPTPLRTAMIERAVRFLSSMEFSITHEIRVVESLGDERLLGLAKDNIIWLSKSVFDLGTKMVAGTILEEELHLSRGLEDCSREMQNFLFNALMTMGERMKGEPL